MVKLRHTFLLSLLFHAGIFALMSPFILSMGEAGKKMTEQIIVDLVDGVSRKVSIPVPKAAQQEKTKIKDQLKKARSPVMKKEVPSVAKPIAPVEESIAEAIAEKEIVKEALSTIESATKEEEPLSLQVDTQSDSHTEEYSKKGGSAEVREAENAESYFDKSANYSLILEKIEAARWYPRVARKRGIEGVTVVKFRIAPDGNVMDIIIDQASGFSILDNAAIKTIRRAAPFPRFDSLLKVAVTFKLT